MRSLFSHPELKNSMDETGIWWGMVAGEIVGGLFAFTWVCVYLLRLDRWSREEPVISKQVSGQ